MINIMKKFFNNLSNPNTAKTTKVIRSIQATTVTLAGTTFAMNKPDLAFYLLAGAGAADLILSAFDNGDSTKG